MSTTFRPYAPDQMLLLPADLRAWLPAGPLGSAPRQRPGGRCASQFDGVLRAVCGGRSAQRALCTADDGRRCCLYARMRPIGGVLVARDRRKLEEDVAFRVLGAGNFPLRRSDAVRVPAVGT